MAIHLQRRLRNPVLWRDLLYFQRAAQRWQRYEAHCAFALAGVSLFFALSLLDLAAQRRDSPLQITIILLWTFHTVTCVRAIIAGANSVSREYIGLTWDSLVLTGISARRILSGKLRAALRSVLPWMVAFGMLRLLTLPLMSVNLTSLYAYVQCYVRSSSTYCSANAVSWLPWAWFLAVLLAVVLTILEVVTCVALGVAASTVLRRPIPAAIAALIIRFIPVALFAGFSRYQLGNTFFWRYWSNTPFTVADGGTVGLMQLAFPRMIWTWGEHEAAVPGLVGVLVSLLLLLGGAAWVSLWMMRRVGALTERQTRLQQPLSSANAPL